MFKKITFSVALSLISISSAYSQTSELPVLVKKIKDTQLYLSDLSSISIENPSGSIRHRIIGSTSYSTTRCGTLDTKCVGMPAPQPTELIADESGGTAPTSSLGVFGACRRVIESAKPTDTFLLRGDFERLEHQTTDTIHIRPRLFIKKLTSCFHYRSLPGKLSQTSATE